MSIKHPNFYENLKEAQFRLLRSVVLYDGEPYSVFAITNHKKDEKFRIYLQPLVLDETKPYPEFGHIPQDHASLGDAIDKWMETSVGKASQMLRKQMDSPLFNGFRPFPLGMCNYNARTYYLERTPVRQSRQGLTYDMIQETNVSATPQEKDNGRNGLQSVMLTSPAVHACIKGDYPTAAECLKNLNDPEVRNTAVGFDRLFAFVRGPLDMMFLAYKRDIVGVLPHGDLTHVRLGREFRHVREVTEKLDVFDVISVG